MEQALAAHAACEQEKRLNLSMRWLARKRGSGVPKCGAAELGKPPPPPLTGPEPLATILAQLAQLAQLARELAADRELRGPRKESRCLNAQSGAA